MSLDCVKRYEQLITRANEYHKTAKWQEKLRLLQEALDICEELGFPEVPQRKQELFYEIAGIWRRLGQYEKAEKTLKQSLDVYPQASSTFKASVLGELGVMARHNGRFIEARDAFREQGRLARHEPQSAEADAEICRAIGNEGMCSYNLAVQTEPHDIEMLNTGVDQLRERITRAQELEQRLRTEKPRSRPTVEMARAWATIGRDRLTLCLIALGNTEEAVRVAEESQRLQTREDPTVTGFSKFFYGNAQWHNGQRHEALQQWNAPRGTCNSVMALCKEPGEEFNQYLQLMASAGVDFDSYDEQGFSALDHAVLSGSPSATDAALIITNALREALQQDLQRQQPALGPEAIRQRIEDEITARMRQSEIRRQYRTILQEHIRPLLRLKPEEVFNSLRSTYAKFLSEDTEERRMFSTFRYVKYLDFLSHGQLPISTAGLTKEFSIDGGSVEAGAEDYVIFMSYRWIGGDRPDDSNGTQWRCMKGAVENYLKKNPAIHESRVGLWIDYACIDQENEQEKMRGVDALPLAVTQCNAMISLVDETYYERAWCAIEVMLMRALMESYGLHEWWELSDGTLQRATTARVFEVGNLKLTKETLDRPKIDFLMRQSKLLGKDYSK